MDDDDVSVSYKLHVSPFSFLLLLPFSLRLLSAGPSASDHYFPGDFSFSSSLPVVCVCILCRLFCVRVACPLPGLFGEEEVMWLRFYL